MFVWLCYVVSSLSFFLSLWIMASQPEKRLRMFDIDEHTKLEKEADNELHLYLQSNPSIELTSETGGGGGGGGGEESSGTHIGKKDKTSEHDTEEKDDVLDIKIIRQLIEAERSLHTLQNEVLRINTLLYERELERKLKTDLKELTMNDGRWYAIQPNKFVMSGGSISPQAQWALFFKHCGKWGWDTKEIYIYCEVRTTYGTGLNLADYDGPIHALSNENKDDYYFVDETKDDDLMDGTLMCDWRYYQYKYDLGRDVISKDDDCHTCVLEHNEGTYATGKISVSAILIRLKKPTASAAASAAAAPVASSSPPPASAAAAAATTTNVTVQ